MWGKVIKNKFGAKRTIHHGRSFASKLEAALYDQLLLLEKAGEIREIRCQHHTYLTRSRINYIADFSAFEFKRACTVFYEAKGYSTPVWQLKLKLWRFYGDGPLQIWGGSYNRLILLEEVIPSEIE